MANLKQICELSEETAGEPKRRMLSFTPSEFATLERWSGFSTPIGVKQAIVSLAKQCLSKQLEIVEVETETPADKPTE